MDLMEDLKIESLNMNLAEEIRKWRYVIQSKEI